ncbi:hypothetical protein BDV98DRAFT_573368 [Pterulicium gracile]|uniref:Uncharacterized protein n=1 Tax=Pterulicium gracile TaxID=1884261 RepID=A0A5C3QCY6_9AGAR|nr:hypothetical protein BDV98DRAFT_573368 [Pterula gracilis]
MGVWFMFRSFISFHFVLLFVLLAIPLGDTPWWLLLSSFIIIDPPDPTPIIIIVLY